jgi:hypothetical protein
MGRTLFKKFIRKRFDFDFKINDTSVLQAEFLVFIGNVFLIVVILYFITGALNVGVLWHLVPAVPLSVWFSVKRLQTLNYIWSGFGGTALTFGELGMPSTDDHHLIFVYEKRLKNWLMEHFQENDYIFSSNDRTVTFKTADLAMHCKLKYNAVID